MTAFRWYLGGSTCWFAGTGLQMILFAWLVTVVQRQAPDRVGIAQMFLTAPAIAFLLLGGVIADRADCRTLLIRYQLLAVLPPAGLAVLIAGGALSYAALLGYGVAVGTLAALVVPARDALLTRVVPSGLPRAIAVTTAAQFGAQLVGIVIGGTANRVGAVTLLSVQAGIMALGAVAVARLDPAPPRSAESHRQSRLAAMLDGLREARRSDRIQPMIVAMFAVGVCYVGPFMVILPLLVRDAYGGGSAELAVVNVCFWGGTIGASLAQVRLGEVRRPGRAVLVALAGGAVVLAAMALPTPFYGLALLCLVWGVGAGVTMTQGRTIVQLAAPESHRARILSLFQMGFMGGAPVGALVIGYVARLVGARAATVFPALVMIAVLAFLLLRSGLWKDDQTGGLEGPPVPPDARSAPAKPGHSSNLRETP